MAKKRFHFQNQEQINKKPKSLFGVIVITAIIIFVAFLGISIIVDAFTNKLLVIPVKGEITSEDAGFLIFVQDNFLPGKSKQRSNCKSCIA